MRADTLCTAESGESGGCVVFGTLFIIRVLIIEAIVIFVCMWWRDIEESVSRGKDTVAWYDTGDW